MHDLYLIEVIDSADDEMVEISFKIEEYFKLFLEHVFEGTDAEQLELLI